LAREAVAAFAQDHRLALRIGADDPGGVGDVPRSRSDRPRYLDFRRLAGRTAALIHVHMTVIVRLHLRSGRASLAQQQAGQKDDHQAVPWGEFHKSASLSSGNCRCAASLRRRTSSSWIDWVHDPEC
jgi:hypothetical protein